MSTYKTSDSTAILFAAVSAAQSQFAGAKKDAVNPAFRSKYADLASVWDAVREHLTENKLAIIQIPTAEANVVTVTTILTHASGEWISGELAMTSEKFTPQGIGSCITYARRYALSAFLGIAPEDDDGNEASQGKGTAPAAQKRPEPRTQEQANKSGGPSGDMKAAFDEMKSLLGDKLYAFILKSWEIKDPSELDREKAKVLYKQMGVAKKAVTAASHGEVLPEMNAVIFGCLPDSSVSAILNEYKNKLKMLMGDDIGLDEYEDARKVSADQWEFATALQLRVNHAAKQQGLA